MKATIVDTDIIEEVVNKTYTVRVNNRTVKINKWHTYYKDTQEHDGDIVMISSKDKDLLTDEEYDAVMDAVSDAD